MTDAAGGIPRRLHRQMHESAARVQLRIPVPMIAVFDSVIDGSTADKVAAWADRRASHC